MINITSPIKDTLLYNDTIYVEYEVSENSKSTDKVVFFIDSTKFEKTELKGRFAVSDLKEGKHQIRAYLVNKLNKKIIGSEVKIFFYTNTDVIELKNKLSSVVPYQLPEFIREDYQKFVSFIQSYYQFLEQSNDPKLAPLSSYSFSDVDISPEIFNEKFRKQFIPDFPSNLTVDKETGKPLNLKTLIKRASEFYRSKGTENSFNFIFKILYDEGVQFYYPREHLFVVSGGLWNEKKTIKIFSGNNERTRLFSGNKIYQLNDEGEQIVTARVLSCSIYKQSPYNVAELELVEIIGDFDANYPILCDIVEDGAEETLSYYPKRGISEIEITSSGYNYRIGDRVFLNPVPNNSDGTTDPEKSASGVGYTGTVTVRGSRGEIEKIESVNFGINYEEDPEQRYDISIISDFGTGFDGDAVSSVLCQYRGYYSTSNGVLGDRSFIQDNDYYQTHSYEIISSIPLQSYYDVIKRTVHPAGYKLFGSQVITPSLTIELNTESDKSTIELLGSLYIGNYIAYRINGDVNLRNGPIGSNNYDLFPEGVNPDNEIPPDSDGYFIHDTSGRPEDRNIQSANFDELESFSDLIPDWDNRNAYWVVFPHPKVFINTDESQEIFYDLTIGSVAVLSQETRNGVSI